jgi:hypothetical protein
MGLSNKAPVLMAVSPHLADQCGPTRLTARRPCRPVCLASLSRYDDLQRAREHHYAEPWTDAFTKGYSQSQPPSIDMYSLSTERKHRGSYPYMPRSLGPSPKGLVPYITLQPHMLHNAMECFR